MIETEEGRDGGGDVGETGVFKVFYLILFAVFRIVVNHERDEVRRMRSLRLAVFIDELFGVTVVGGDD